MSVLSVQAVARRFGERLLFSEVSFRLARGDRVGLVGPNGVGKTTLLRIAAGFDAPDAGNVALARGTRIGFLEQELLGESAGSVDEHARGAAAHLRELEAEMRALEPRLATGDDEALGAYADVQHRFEHAGGYDFEATLGRVLGGLGLNDLREREVRTLSGGERTRLGLARLLLDDPDLLLLDEPTNHLDVAALEWLERFLIEQESTILVSSHDRWFLDRVTSRTLSFERGTVVEYRGGYSQYARQRAERDASLEKASAKQAEEIARTEEFIRRYGAGQRSKEARGRGKRLARVERIQGPEQVQRHGWRLEAAHLAGDTVIETTSLAVGYTAPLVRTGALRIARDARVAVVGPNGAGKTTLVRTLVGDLAALEGYVSSAPTARVAFLAQAQSELTGDETVIDAMRRALPMDEQEAREHLARFLFRGDDVFKSVGVLSGGERSRLALARLAARHANLLVLDEPTNHLDLLAREQLEAVLQTFEGALLVVSHDRYFIDKLATEIWPIEAGVLKRFEGNWTGLQRLRASGAALPMPDLATAGGPVPARGPLARRSPPVPRSRQRGRPAGTGPGHPRLASDSPRRATPGGRSTSKASAARRIEGARALEARIEAMELQLRQLEEKVSQIAQSGNYLETRRIGEEHESLARSLRELYDEWTRESEKTE
ncbi:MAG: ATP-binding cassette domain-containing protein [Chloroflexi bacterium]|nr:MAG: ATP-binding cassette domain-containing protein [Chloroflexota bacterium]